MISQFIRNNRRLVCAAAFVAAGLTCAPVSYAANLGEALPIRLNSSVTVTEEVVRLRDLFGGDLMRGDKVVAQAPAAGQRVTLSAEWLANLAHTNGIDWQPAGAYDRAMVYRPGQTVTAGEITAAIRAELTTHGMPRNFGLKPFTAITSATIGLNASKTVKVREALYDSATSSFSAVVEIAAGDPTASFMPVRGMTLPVVSVPTLKQGIARNTALSADMVEMIDLPESEIASDTVLSVNGLIGMTPRSYLKSGQSIRSSEIYRLNLTEVPVLRAEMRRGGEISAADIVWVAVNADDLPNDAVTTEDQLIGKAARRFLSAKTAIRRGDVQNLVVVEVPVAARDLRRGMTLSAGDLNWVRVPENEIVGEIVRSEKELVGRIANTGVRAGQTFRTLSVIRPVAIPKGKLITVIYNSHKMSLTARGKVLEDGAIGQVIRVNNTKSNHVVFAEVIDEATVRVTEQQTAMN